MNVLQGIDSMRWRLSLLFLFIVFLTAEISLSSGAKNRQEVKMEVEETKWQNMIFPFSQMWKLLE